LATTVSRPAEISSAARIPAGVAPLRAGQGRSFLWRRLHSLSGIVPVGTFLIEHFASNAFATNGPWAYADQVKFLTGLPFAVWLEVFGIYIPILYHALYGFWIWYRGESNVGEYAWASNWMYTTQRWTGALTFAYIAYHTYVMRFTGEHLFTNAQASFWKVQQEFQHPYAVAFYIIGIAAASWHFGYGIFLFCAKWGIVTGEKARRRVMGVGIAIALLFIVIGYATMFAFFKPEWRNTPKQLPPKTAVVQTH
jgi:succinate dehydrogenase / fumarate reductase, cytochrome b subunit